MNDADANGVLPEGWAATTVGAAATISKVKVDPRDVPDSPYLGLEHVEANTRRIIGQGRATDVKSTKCAFHAGDILYGKLRPYLNKVARPNYDGICSTDFLVFGRSPVLDSGFFAWFISQPSFVEFAHHASNGVELPRVGWKALATYSMALPPLGEQRRIAARLGDIEAHRASVAAHLQTARSALERFRRAVFAAACSGRLTEDWRDERPRARRDDLLLLAEERRRARGKRFVAPQINPHTRGGDLPENWTLAPLGLLLDDLKYGTSKRSAYDQPGTPVLRIPNVSAGVLDVEHLKFAHLDDRERGALRLHPGDLLMIRSNGSVQLVGVTVAVTSAAEGMAYAGYLMRLRADREFLEPEFLRLTLASPQLRHQIELPARSTSGVHNINTQEVRGLGVPVPSLDEQAEIVRRATVALTTVDRMAFQIGQADRTLDRVSRASLTKAFRGELVPTEAALAADEDRDFESAREGSRASHYDEHDPRRERWADVMIERGWRR